MNLNPCIGRSWQRLFWLPMLFILFSCSASRQLPTAEKQQTPIMGWSSWNHFKITINEEIVKAQADFMARPEMRDAGYRFINIDDGYFGGRDDRGNLLINQSKFPSGMKAVADYIHSKGLKAGIYTDAGVNTCASHWDQDTSGVGMGLFGHEKNDLKLTLGTWGFDFIKVDWCGGEWLGLDEQTQYTLISNLIKSINNQVIFNVCRWQFPGKWVVNAADSWRISADIGNNFSSILHIIDKNEDLWKYAGPGHVNDMDMLQIGRGMSYEEDKTHFTMWSIMCSPLLLGNDLTKMSDSTLQIITNKEIIALNQDPLVYQARKIQESNQTQIWAKPLTSTMSGNVGVALLNRSDETKTITLIVDSIGINAGDGYTVRNLWERKDFAPSKEKQVSFNVPAHGVIALRISGTARPFNIFQTARP